MAKPKMEPEIMEGLAHRVWEETCNINKLCSRQTKGALFLTVTSALSSQAQWYRQSCSHCPVLIPLVIIRVTWDMTLLPVN